MVSSAIEIVMALLLGWLCASSLYLCVLGLSSCFRKRSTAPIGLPLTDSQLTVLIPAYKNDAVLLESAESNLEILHKIPQLNFNYVVLVDHVKAATTKQLEKMGATVFQVSLENPTKSRAINQWLENTPNLTGQVLLLDVDNIVVENNIQEALALAQKNSNTWFQWQRTAANSNTEIASLDAWSEAVNNNIFRTGAQNLGIRPSIIGSAMIVAGPIFRQMHVGIDVTGGFDKWLEHYLIQHKIPVKYLSWVRVKDQKTASSEALHKQRTRWVAAQYETAKALWLTFMASIIKLRWLAALKYFQLYLPPRVLHLAISVFACALWFYETAWGVIATVNVLTLALALLVSTSTGMHAKVFKLILKRGWSLVWSYLSMTSKFKEANKKFLVTEHKRNEENHSH